VGGHWPPENGQEADSFVQGALRERLLPLLLAEKAGLPLVSAALGRVSAWRHVFARRAAILSQAIARLPELLAEEPFLFLKGADYRSRLYRRPELRPMQDIDILVPRERMDAVTRRLLDAGLGQRFPAGPAGRIPSYHERVFDLGDVTVEVHHSFLQRIRFRIDYDAIWRRREPLLSGQVRAHRLGDVDAIAYHALSLSADEFSTSLVRYLDFWLLLGHRPEILSEAVARAREWGAQRSLYGALRQTARLFPEFDTTAVQSAERDLLARPVRFFFDRAVLPRPGRPAPASYRGRGLQLWRKLWVIGSFPRRAGFALYHGYALIEGRRLERAAKRRRG
jgi:hypothetical protein